MWCIFLKHICTFLMQKKPQQTRITLALLTYNILQYFTVPLIISHVFLFGFMVFFHHMAIITYLTKYT